MKRKHFILALAAMLLSFAPPIFAQVAKVGDAKYTTLAEAISKASAGGTVELMADVNESVTIGKSLTIVGNDNKLTGKITTDGKSMNITIKNIVFDGNDKSIDYAVRADDNLNFVIENCKANNYGYGFLYANKNNSKVTVKNVVVENCNYGARMISVSVANLVNFVTRDVMYPVQIDAKSSRTVNMTDCSITKIKEGGAALSCSAGSSNITFNFKGTNVFDAELPVAANLVYKEVETDGIDNVVVTKPAVAKIGEQGYETFAAAVAAATAGQTITLLADVAESVTIGKSLTMQGLGPIAPACLSQYL